MRPITQLNVPRSSVKRLDKSRLAFVFEHTNSPTQFRCEILISLLSVLSFEALASAHLGFREDDGTIYSTTLSCGQDPGRAHHPRPVEPLASTLILETLDAHLQAASALCFTASLALSPENTVLSRHMA